MEYLLETLKHALLITFFVFSMMILLDYITVYFKSDIDLKLENNGRQYIFSSFLGVIPGCLGSFFNVSLYLRGLLSFGAISGAMIATSGDEAFVMLAMFPDKALILFVILFFLGVFSGWLTDKIPYLNKGHIEQCHFPVKHKEDLCECFNFKTLLKEWKKLSFIRFFLTFTAVSLLLLILTNLIGPSVWNWKKYTLVILAAFTTFIVTTVPEHYLNIHIWEHIFKKHIWKIFLWTFFALAFTHLALNHLDLMSFVNDHLGEVFIIAILIGLIPESGPHLIFVTLFAQGVIPFSVLLASSIVQDGHGILPLLSHSVNDVIKIKLINAAFALIIGGLFFLFGL